MLLPALPCVSPNTVDNAPGALRGVLPAIQRYGQRTPTCGAGSTLPLFQPGTLGTELGVRRVEHDTYQKQLAA